MSRPKGSKNKPKDELRVIRWQNLKDIITPDQACEWLDINRPEFMRQIREKEIPEDCYYMVGTNYKIITRKLGELKGIIPKQIIISQELIDQLTQSMQETARAEIYRTFGQMFGQQIQSSLPPNVIPFSRAQG
jgi:hypothetical protein